MENSSITQSHLNTFNYHHHHHHVFPKQEYEDVFSIPSQLPPLDHFSGILGCNNNGWTWDFHDHEVGMQEPLPLLYDDPFYCPPLDFSHTLFPFPEVLFESAFGGWDEIGTEYFGEADQSPPPPLLLDYNNVMIDEKLSEEEKLQKRGIKRPCRDEEERNSKKLTRKIISQYFYMPITQAARELNVGLTLLKKRCRELGIRRWPHRKLMSLQTLINNVQAEFGKEESEGKLQEYLQILEQEKKLMEEIPDMQLEDKTKRLRQAFFKANYKKRKLMGTVDSSPKTRASANPITPPDHEINAAANFSGGFDEDDYEEEDEGLKLLFSDCFSSPPSF